MCLILGMYHKTLRRCDGKLLENPKCSASGNDIQIRTCCAPLDFETSPFSPISPLSRRATAAAIRTVALPAPILLVYVGARTKKFPDNSPVYGATFARTSRPGRATDGTGSWAGDIARSTGTSGTSQAE